MTPSTRAAPDRAPVPPLLPVCDAPSTDADAGGEPPGSVVTGVPDVVDVVDDAGGMVVGPIPVVVEGADRSDVDVCVGGGGVGVGGGVGGMVDGLGPCPPEAVVDVEDGLAEVVVGLWPGVVVVEPCGGGFGGSVVGGEALPWAAAAMSTVRTTGVAHIKPPARLA